MWHKYSDVWLTISLTMTSIILAITSISVEVIQIVLALLFVLFLPGYALVAALFSNDSLGFPTRLLFSVGLSVALSALGGLFLNFTPWGIQAYSWVGLLSSITLIASCIAFVRRQKQSRTAIKPDWPRLNIRPVQALQFGIAAIIIVAAFGLAAQGAVSQQNISFTQLWILPSDTNNKNIVRVGIRNIENKTVQYKLQIESESISIYDWHSIELQPGQQWEETVSLNIVQSHAKSVEAKLYRLDNPGTVYRQVNLLLRN